VTQGATTIWERWDGQKPDGTFQDPGMNSFNHYAYGAIGDWLYRKVAGIDLDPDVPGFRSIIIKPHPGAEMNDVSATHHSPYGRVSSGWEIENGEFILRVSIPVNTIADIHVPSNAESLTVNGNDIMAAKKVKPVGLDYHFLKIRVGSGNYTLISGYER
jgi:alpha-L-rhamnosidase